jgi:hypothetical protein
LTGIAFAAGERVAIGSYQADVGSMVDISVNVTGAENVAGGSVKIIFNNSVIIVENVVEADFGSPIANVNNTEGFVHIAVARATSVGKTNATLAIIRFRGIGEGNTPLRIEDVELSDEKGNVTIPQLAGQGNIYLIPEFPSFFVGLTLVISASLVAAYEKLARRIEPRR